MTLEPSKLGLECDYSMWDCGGMDMKENAVDRAEEEEGGETIEIGEDATLHGNMTQKGRWARSRLHVVYHPIT